MGKQSQVDGQNSDDGEEKEFFTFDDLNPDEENDDDNDNEEKDDQDGSDDSDEDDSDSNDDEDDSDSDDEDEDEDEDDDNDNNDDSEFVFDKKKYLDMGIENEKALAEIEKKDRQVFEKQKIIGKQGKNLGDERGKNKDLESQINSLTKERSDLATKADITDDEYDDLTPTERKEVDKAKDRVANIDGEIRRSQTRKFLEESVEDFDDSIGDMAELIKMDMPGERGVLAAAQLRKDAYNFDAGTLFNLHKRVELSKEMKALKKANAKMKKQIRENPGKVRKKINKMLDDPAGVSSNAGNSGNNKQSFTAAQMLYSSSDQLDKMMENIKE